MEWTRSLLLALTTMLTALALAGTKPARDRCDGCIRLAKIEARAKRNMLLPEDKFAPLVIEAAQAITDIARKNPKLDEKRVDAVVAVYRLFVPKDHSGVLLKLTSPMIVANRDAIDAKVALLPKEESAYLADAIDKATMVTKAPGEEGAKATPPPPSTPPDQPSF